MSTYRELLSYCEDRDVQLVAVSKTKPNEAILELYAQGQRIFGENRPQELQEKYNALPKDIEWHMIGHLQTNKVKFIIPFVSMIHSGNRASVLKEIQSQAAKHDRVVDVLIQIRIAEEETKSGWDFEELSSFMVEKDFHDYTNIRWRGVMGMATFTNDQSQVGKEFAALKSHFDVLKNEYFVDKDAFDTISMGMSGDYKLAIEQGSTMVRIGSLLFGSR